MCAQKKNSHSCEWRIFHEQGRGGQVFSMFRIHTYEPFGGVVLSRRGFPGVSMLKVCFARIPRSHLSTSSFRSNSDITCERKDDNGALLAARCSTQITHSLIRFESVGDGFQCCFVGLLLRAHVFIVKAFFLEFHHSKLSLERWKVSGKYYRVEAIEKSVKARGSRDDNCNGTTICPFL